MKDLLCILVALAIVFAVIAIARISEKFVGAGTDMAVRSGFAYNSGADIRKKSYSEDNLGEYIKCLEKREVEFVNRRSKLSRFDWNSVDLPASQANVVQKA